MSNLIYPVLPGLAWPIKRTPMWKTTVKRTPSGREFRTTAMSYPTYRYSLQYEFLRNGAAYQEFQSLFGLVDKCLGAYDTFLFSDPADNAVSGQSLGAGNGSQTAFQLGRSIGGAFVPVFDLNGAPTVFVNGSAVTSTPGANGLVTLAAPPAAGSAVTWSGGYYWRCRFESDEIEFERFMQQFWSSGQVRLLTVKP